MARFLAGGRLDDTSVSNIAFSAGTSYYIPVYSFGGGGLTLIDIGVGGKGASLSELQWEILSYSGGAPGSSLASGAIQGSGITASQWLSITISSVTLSPYTWYLLKLTPVGDTFTIQSYASGWAQTHLVLHSRHVQYRILTWSGTAWTAVGSKYLSVIYQVGNAWYGNPFTVADNGPQASGNGAGNSYLLDKSVAVVGAFIMVSNGSGTYTVNLYECGADFLPSGSPVRTVTVPQTAPAVYWEPYQASRFSIIVVDSSRFIRSVRDSYSGDASRLNAVCPEIRGVNNSGSGWQLTTISGKQIVVAGIYPIIEYDGYTTAGGTVGGFPFPPHVVLT